MSSSPKMCLDGRSLCKPCVAARHRDGNNTAATRRYRHRRPSHVGASSASSPATTGTQITMGTRRDDGVSNTPSPHTFRAPPSPPAHFMQFKVRKTLRVPVVEYRQPDAVAATLSSASDTHQIASFSLDEWIQSPARFMGVVFTADLITPTPGTDEKEWTIRIMNTPLMHWNNQPLLEIS